MINSDNYYMAYALRLAERGLWSTQPNPRVGCVIVKNDKIVGEGYHQVAGQPHAEVYALQQAQINAENSTCYVTLEPCCHYGRTPPCADALIQAGVARVVVAMADPNPLVAGKGIAKLLNAGISVDIGVLSSQAEQLNCGFISRMRRHRPYIRCKMAMSLDGRTAMASGQSQWITSADARCDVQGLRARSSAIMTGINTIVADNPSLTVRTEELPDYLPKPVIIQQPVRVIVDTQLRIAHDARVLTLPGQTVIFTATRHEKTEDILRQLGVQVNYVPDFNGKIDLQAVCQQLAAQYQVNELLLESGATLSGSMLQADLIDEFVIYVAPILMGNQARGLFNLPTLDYLEQRIQLNIQEIRAIGCDWRITAYPVVQR